MFCGLLHIDTPILADHQKLTYINSVQTLDAVKRTGQVQWLIELREYMLLVQHNHN